MYRIKYLLGSMVAIFSVVYLLFGIVGWVDGSVDFRDLLTCFILASLHLAGGGYLLLSSLRDYRNERQRVDSVIRSLIRTNGGKVLAAELARQADISDDDATEYLMKRSKYDVSIVLQSTNGEDVFFFGQRFWNN